MRVHLRFPTSARGRRALLSVAILGISLAASAYLMLATAPGKSIGNTPGFEASAAGALSQNLNFVRALPNLTNEFTDQALERLIAQNETLKAGGEAAQNPKLLPEEADVAAIISKIIDDELATEAIKESDLKVNASDAKETQLVYLLFVDQALKTQGNEMPDLADRSLTAYFTDTAAKLDETAEILKAVKAPPSWLGIHRDLVAFFLKQRNIYRSLGAADTDPLRFTIATTRLLPAEAEEEFQKIQAKIEQKITDEKLI
ncbi:hypothetical protein COU12_00750 [Candidatus Jorgensenbacteria bacterium CG10_big_fil_rev_8_21_14_0_10_54_38]|uniref:Uncharacterized protein n=2 Tax=Candidatus Joergenseniibacteriota TaxID=1752739 RepID=A0A2M6WGM9_9BACT|nr:MAG: hypothetical protein COX26_00010 [Candidatus Jorgensenbacteria bacterium CG23_combo_of_CG06-09_8_20_14_all_54_14]PIT91864.1 MAG: hypothetical protein COU12_00750 [Candidatus Jorgensenbacteria bacterium CG10_big_fil_rev_8_21_14_0_10_54_38]